MTSYFFFSFLCFKNFSYNFCFHLDDFLILLDIQGLLCFWGIHMIGIMAKHNINKILDFSNFLQNNQVYTEIDRHYYKLPVSEFKNTCWPPSTPTYPGCDSQFGRKKSNSQSFINKKLITKFILMQKDSLWLPHYPMGVYVKGLGSHSDWQMLLLSSRNLWKAHCLIFEMNLLFHTLMTVWYFNIHLMITWTI